MPLLAAGGITSGSQIASLLTLGASGCTVGTRFLACPSSLYSPAKKRAILAASSKDAVRSFAFDWLQSRTGWPDGVDGRGLRIPAVISFDEVNESAMDQAEVEKTRDEAKKRFKEAEETGKEEGLVVWAGTGVGEVNKAMEANVSVPLS